jgi:hypothetical protein
VKDASMTLCTLRPVFENAYLASQCAEPEVPRGPDRAEGDIEVLCPGTKHRHMPAASAPVSLPNTGSENTTGRHFLSRAAAM